MFEVVNVGEILEDVRAHHARSHKEMATDLYGKADTSRLHKSIEGQLSLDLWQLTNLDLELLVELFTRILAEKSRERLEAFKPEPVKSELRARAKKEIA